MSPVPLRRPKAIVLFGYPGSGKGTQGKLLAALPGFFHIATGDILRGVRPGHPRYEELQTILASGDLVSDELVMDLFRHHVETLGPGDRDYLLVDGLPRNARQVELLNQVVDVIRIFKLSVYDETLVIDRMKKRALAQGRPDDASDLTIQHRLAVYRHETESSVRAYPGTVLTRIQANQSVFDVHLDIMNALAKLRNLTFR